MEVPQVLTIAFSLMADLLSFWGYVSVAASGAGLAVKVRRRFGSLALLPHDTCKSRDETELEKHSVTNVKVCKAVELPHLWKQEKLYNERHAHA